MRYYLQLLSPIPFVYSNLTDDINRFDAVIEDSHSQVALAKRDHIDGCVGVPSVSLRWRESAPTVLLITGILGTKKSGGGFDSPNGSSRYALLCEIHV